MAIDLDELQTAAFFEADLGNATLALERAYDLHLPIKGSPGRAIEVVIPTDLLDEAWWFPAMCWPDGRLQFMLNERMMPAQFVVNGAGERFINEAAPYMDFAHAMIEGQQNGVEHIPCWLITDIKSFHRYVVGGHLPIPKVPFAPENPLRSGFPRAPMCWALPPPTANGFPRSIARPATSWSAASTPAR